ncbi:hypothetical protein BDY17DRAFT_13395 [Neohortaea acidophila]|uniref:Uncharacterized protein n=1 Tax=Neohortaea acidophila TaxID=245834 RepID=A0A6A6Q587_9PEZI|nr:uncharacterized protein BDY17DRAFT_13395 [Neohortaea acidophila]KAF2487550.1 hypothetical protein BDY17DRAFT_13395 [Neohortaea acidophila]
MSKLPRTDCSTHFRPHAASRLHIPRPQGWTDGGMVDGGPEAVNQPHRPVVVVLLSPSFHRVGDLQSMSRRRMTNPAGHERVGSSAARAPHPQTLGSVLVLRLRWARQASCVSMFGIRPKHLLPFSDAYSVESHPVRWHRAVHIVSKYNPILSFRP